MTAPVVIDTIDRMRVVIAEQRAAGRRIALTPTLGALHEGHLTHVDRAAELAEVRVVSIFVNPTQFTEDADFERYPRTLEADTARLAEHGVDFVFAPGLQQMYPDGPTSTIVSAGPVGDTFEGASRPGHFDGVLTVVAKLLGIVLPDVATFGRKDAQQLFLVQRMVADLNLPVRIEPIETVREADGLAMSSRNRFLSAGERAASLVLSRALGAAAASGADGRDAALAAGRALFAAEPLVELDYFELVHPRSFAPVPADHRGEAIAITAARLGATRLIDNALLTLA